MKSKRTTSSSRVTSPGIYLCLILLMSGSIAQPAFGQIADGEIAETPDDPQDETQAEFDRRMESLAKSIEKEDRPDTPSFSGLNRAPHNGVITFDDLKFEMDKGQKFQRKMLADSINELTGQRLKLKGYIRPSIRQKDLTKFIFVRDDKECCFGPGAALYDCVLVTLKAGNKSDYTVRPITIEGEFFLKEYTGPDGRVWAVYRMKDGEVK